MDRDVLRPLGAEHYTRWDTKTLLTAFVVLRGLAQRWVRSWLHSPQDRAAKTFRRALFLMDMPTPRDVGRLRILCPDTATFHALCQVRAELHVMGSELHTRLGSQPVGRALIGTMGASGTSREFRALAKVLGIARLSRSNRPRVEDGKDLQGVALLAAYERYDRLTRDNSYAVPEFLPLPVSRALVAEMTALPDPLGADFVRQQVEYELRRILPALQGDAEGLRGRSRQNLRDHYEKRHAKKRTVEKADGTADEPTYVELSHESVELGDVAQIAENRALAKKLYVEAERRWPQRGAIFVEALLAGDNVSTAAKKAGVTPQMGHKYKIELRKTVKQADAEEESDQQSV